MKNFMVGIILSMGAENLPRTVLQAATFMHLYKNMMEF